MRTREDKLDPYSRDAVIGELSRAIKTGEISPASPQELMKALLCFVENNVDNSSLYFKSMDSAPKEREIVVWYDHQYEGPTPGDKERYAAYLRFNHQLYALPGSGICIARLFYVSSQAVWFAKGLYSEYNRSINPVAWGEIPKFE